MREAEEDEKSDFNVTHTFKEYNSETGLDETKSLDYRGAIYFNKDGFNPEVISHVD